MKKSFAIIIFAFSCLLACNAQGKIITVNELPVGCNDFIKTHFTGTEIKSVVLKSDVTAVFEVTLKNGIKIEFNKKGEWTEVETKMLKVPSTIIPAPINEYVSINHPKVAVSMIEKEGTNTKIRLSDGSELKFNKAYQIIDVDNE
jgi:hypothetical protein